jgi:dipeptidyl aminopeptidase/acylaminoacyl peptidase
MCALRIAALLAAFAAGLPGVSVAADDAKPVPMEAFFKYADYGALELSPTGKYIGALVPVQGQVRLLVIDLDTKASRIVASAEGGDVLWFAWVNDERLILQGGIVKDSLEYRRGTPMAAVNADGTEFVKLDTRSFFSVLRDGSDNVLVRSYQFNRRYPNLVRLNTKTNRDALMTLGKPGDVFRWVVDRKGAVRAAVTDEEKGLASRVFWRADESSPWVQLGEFKLGASRIFPIGFDGDGTLIVASNIGRDTFAIYRYDTERKALGEELVAHPQADLTGGLVFDRLKNRVVGIRYDGPRPGAAWFDEDWARLQKTIDASLPDHMNVLSNAGKRVLVYSYSDIDPGSYYLFDVEKRRLDFVAARRKAIKPEAMPPRSPVRFAARDGLEIPGYLTLPKGKDPKKLPLVLYVHGGPFVHGASWGWSPEPAFLASLGYAVLEPEFRGSAGWGTKLHMAGWKQWGRGMQDDLNDGVDWLVKEGIVDPKRVCIMGASYGGYAVMMGLARDSERWRCGIDYVGVTDINLFFDVTWSDYAYSDWIEYAAKEMIGDPVKDAAMLKAASPLENAANIKAPVLMAYGLQDRRVPIVHGEKMHDALVAGHQPVDWVVYREEGHGFFLEKNRFDFYGRVAAFLKAHNPPD